VSKSRTDTERLMLKIRRMKFDDNVAVAGPGVALKSDKTLTPYGRYIADASASVSTCNEAGNVQLNRRGFMSLGETPEKALEDLYRKIRSAYPAPNPFPSIEETEEKIFTHPLNGKLKITNIDCWQSSTYPCSIFNVKAHVRSNLNSARYFGQAIGEFFAVGTTHREALYRLLQHIDGEFSDLNTDGYVIASWYDSYEMFLYVKDYAYNGVEWTLHREEAKLFAPDESRNSYYLEKANQGLPAESRNAYFVKKDCSCARCRHSERNV